LRKRNLIRKDAFHYKWSKSHKPALNVKPGDTVFFEVNEVTSWQVKKNSTSKDLSKIDFSRLYPLAGPVYVEGAEPGDALVVKIEQVKTSDWGWTAIMSDAGLLAEEFKEPKLHIWNLGHNKKFAEFKSGIKVRLNPFCGVYGVTPSEEGYFEVMPPGRHGGNMDVRHLIAGSTLMLPIWTKGALFSVGDVHAAQGDGEVCITAIECPGEVRLTFDLKKNADIQSPQYFTKSTKQGVEPERFVTTGIAPDLMDATKAAVRAMITQLSRSQGISREDAYMLCSVAADLRIHEVVDAPNWLVGLMIDSSIFPNSPI
jgi:acetamidase/formamidase